MHTFIQQQRIDSEDFCNITKDLYFLINAVILSFLFIKESTKKDQFTKTYYALLQSLDLVFGVYLEYKAEVFIFDYSKTTYFIYFTWLQHLSYQSVSNPF